MRLPLAAAMRCVLLLAFIATARCADAPAPVTPAQAEPYRQASDIPDPAALADDAAVITAAKRLEATILMGEAFPELVPLRPAAKACLAGLAQRHVAPIATASEIMHVIDSIDAYFKTCTVEPVKPFLVAEDRKVRERAYQHFALFGGIETAKLLFDVAVAQCEHAGDIAGVDRLLLRAIRQYGPAGRAAVSAYATTKPAEMQVKEALLAQEKWVNGPLRGP